MNGLVILIRSNSNALGMICVVHNQQFLRGTACLIELMRHKLRNHDIVCALYEQNWNLGMLDLIDWPCLSEIKSRTMQGVPLANPHRELRRNVVHTLNLTREGFLCAGKAEIADDCVDLMRVLFL